MNTYAIDAPMQVVSLGSGSHSPFLVHVDEVGPTSVSPLLQLNVMFSPSSAGSSYPSNIRSAIVTGL